MEAGHPAAHGKKDRRRARGKIGRRAICCSSRHGRQVICQIYGLTERGARDLDDGERGGLAGGRRGGPAGGGIGWADRACGGSWRRRSNERERAGRRKERGNEWRRATGERIREMVGPQRCQIWHFMATLWDTRSGEPEEALRVILLVLHSVFHSNYIEAGCNYFKIIKASIIGKKVAS
jgi:hypothetical protein